MRKRRKTNLAAELHFLLGKPVEIMPSRILDRRQMRRVGLHDHLALQVAAPGPPGQLRDQLEGALARPGVGHMQAAFFGQMSLGHTGTQACFTPCMTSPLPAKKTAKLGAGDAVRLREAPP